MVPDPTGEGPSPTRLSPHHFRRGCQIQVVACASDHKSKVPMTPPSLDSVNFLEQLTEFRREQKKGYAVNLTSSGGHMAGRTSSVTKSNRTGRADHRFLTGQVKGGSHIPGL